MLWELESTYVLRNIYLLPLLAHYLDFYMQVNLVNYTTKEIGGMDSWENSKTHYDRWHPFYMQLSDNMSVIPWMGKYADKMTTAWKQWVSIAQIIPRGEQYVTIVILQDYFALFTRGHGGQIRNFA